MPKLVVLTKGKPREIEMGQELTIGRGYSNLLRLEGDEISRVHAIIYHRNNDFIVRDLDSKNGVFVNGSKIAYAHLAPGDRLQVGKYKMIFNPPSNYDVHGDAPRGTKHAAESDVLVATPPAQAEDQSEYTSSGQVNADIASQAPVVEKIAPPPPPLTAYREEVFLLARADVAREMDNTDALERDRLAELQCKFFDALPKSPDSAERFNKLILHTLVKTVGADRGVVILADSTTGDLSPAAMVAGHADVAVNRIVLRSGLTEGKTILCPRTEDSGLFRENETVLRDRIASLISVPLGAGEAFGILYLDRTGEAEEFGMADLLFTYKIARLVELHLTEVRQRETSGNVHK